MLENPESKLNKGNSTSLRELKILNDDNNCLRMLAFLKHKTIKD
jgi:hypothetical protein